MELLKDPLIVVRSEELVARELVAREHAASGSGTSSISRPKSDGRRSCSIQQQLRLFRMDSMDVDCHPCASKQEQIMKFASACREQGLGRAVERSKRSRW